MADIDVHLLSDFDRAQLVAAWKRMFKSPPPRGISQTLMRSIIGFEVQARAQGGLSKSTKNLISRYQKAQAGSVVAKTAPTVSLRPGARLVREWNGVSHVVDVTENAILWNGRSFLSLSAVAKAITGTHWSGPRFFGLTGGVGK